MSGYQQFSNKWYAANNAEAARALFEANIRYGRVQLPPPPPKSEYTPPKWKTCPQHRWIDELLEDVAEFERRLRADLGNRMRDICIR
jgi:hypothetical protein